MATVVAERRSFRECDVETSGAGDTNRDLRHFNCVREAVAQVVVIRSDVDLALAGEAAERTAVLDAVEVALEAGAEPIGLFEDFAPAAAEAAGGERRQRHCLDRFAGPALYQRVGAVGHLDRRVRMSEAHVPEYAGQL
jgi:hypothetical protein